MEPSLEERATVALEKIAEHLEAIRDSVSHLADDGVSVIVDDIRQPAITSLNLVGGR